MAVKVQVSPRGTNKARKQFGGAIAIGKFLSPIQLFRVFDGEELRRILSTGKIEGGSYSIAGERAYGSQWGSNRTEIAQWGEAQRGKRLGHELFMAEIQGKGRSFAHLEGAGGKMDPKAGTIDLDPAFCSSGLGCSLKVETSDVLQWYTVRGGGAEPTPLLELQGQLGQVGLREREIVFYKGTFYKESANAVTRALQLRLVEEEADRTRSDPGPNLRSLKIGVGDYMPEEALGRALFSKICSLRGCDRWGVSIARAEYEAGTNLSNLRQRSFALIACVSATAAVPDMKANLNEASIKFVDVYSKTLREWIRIWNPWGSTRVRFHQRGPEFL